MVAKQGELAAPRAKSEKKTKKKKKEALLISVDELRWSSLPIRASFYIIDHPEAVGQLFIPNFPPPWAGRIC